MKKLSIGLATAVVALAAWAGVPADRATARPPQSCLPELTPDHEPQPGDDGCDEVGNPTEGGTGEGGPFYPQPTPSPTAAVR